MKLFKLLQYIVALFILGVGLIIIALWNIQEDLPNSNISDYFPNEITKIYDSEYDLMYHVGDRDRFYLNYEDMPLEMINAILSAEDKSFFTHSGFDLRGIANAFLVNIKNILIKRNTNYVGASTITQQLVKNILLNNDQTIIRKVKELILSLRIERQYTKEFILELYLNEIYFGRRSYGIASAANNYFQKSIFDLDIHEYAYLAALPKGPNNYDPQKNYQKAFDRRNYVLLQMKENGYLTELDYQKYSKLEIKLAERSDYKYDSDYKTDYILSQISSNNFINNNSFYIQSTINQKIQFLAEKSLLDNLSFFEKKYFNWNGSFENIKDILKYDYSKVWEIAKIVSISESKILLNLVDANKEIEINNEQNLYGSIKINPANFLKINQYLFVTVINNEYFLVQPPKINGSVLIMDPFNGDILAMVGGASYKSSNFNRSTQAFRQPGSSIKPFVYAYAIDSGSFMPNSLILDSNILLDQGYNLPLWIPKNYSNKSYGQMTFRNALETSNNLVTLKIGLDIGLPKINDFFNTIELYQSDKNYDLYSMLLGSIENNLINLTKSYSIFLNGGYIVSPSIIKKVVSDKGEIVINNDYYSCNFCKFKSDDRSYRKPKIKLEKNKVITAQTSFQILNILEGAVQRGTGKSLNAINYPIAGKTGTTNDSKDLWFFGLTPEFVVGVYVGYDQPQKIGFRESGSTVALPVFKSFIENYLIDNQDDNLSFYIPENLILKKVNPKNGSFTTNNDFIHEYFTNEQLETIDNLNKVDEIGGIN